MIFLPFLIINSGPSLIRDRTTIRERKPLNCQRQFSTNELFIRIYDNDENAFLCYTSLLQNIGNEKNILFSGFFEFSRKKIIFQRYRYTDLISHFHILHVINKRYKKTTLQFLSGFWTGEY